ncbi:hypothetical protein [Streptomyces virginiae]|uniref:hypothetical protein n=1 Tax=Streptomyces virginiae TaxID=1961 RepID=UPI003436277A
MGVRRESTCVHTGECRMGSRARACSAREAAEELRTVPGVIACPLCRLQLGSGRLLGEPPVHLGRHGSGQRIGTVPSPGAVELCGAVASHSDRGRWGGAVAGPGCLP